MSARASLNLSNPPSLPPVLKESETFWNKHKVKIGIAIVVGVTLIVTGLAIPIFAAAGATTLFMLFAAKVIGTTAGVFGAVAFGLGALVLLVSAWALKRAIFEKPPGMFDTIKVPFTKEQWNNLRESEQYQAGLNIFKARLERFHPEACPYKRYTCFSHANPVRIVYIVEEEMTSQEGQVGARRIVAQCCLEMHLEVGSGTMVIKLSEETEEKWLDHPIAINDAMAGVAPSLDVVAGEVPDSEVDFETPFTISYDPNSGEDLQDKALRKYGDRLERFQSVDQPNGVSYGYRTVNDYGLCMLFERRTDGTTKDVAEFGLQTSFAVSGSVIVKPIFSNR